MINRYKVCVIGVYFGKLPEYFNLWLKSCEYNKDIDFLIVSDNNFENLPKNVSSTYMTLEDMKKLADKKLGLNTALRKPYKCCDFKAVYGTIFEDLIKDYDFWGHCDFDLIFGKIDSFITDKILDKYDKILRYGHFCLYRNTDEVKSRYKAEGSMCGNYDKVFTQAQSFVFDEVPGIYQIYLKNKFPMYDRLVFADIMPRYGRFKLSQGRKNYFLQCFYWQDGRVYKAYAKNGKVFIDEYIYIHFQKRGFSKTLASTTESFYICPKGFVNKNKNVIPNIEDIRKVNPPQPVREFLVTAKYETIRVTKNILRPLYKLVMERIGGAG